MSLRGAVRTRAEYAEAMHAAWSAPGVTQVEDHIGIGYAVSDGGLLLIVIATVLAWRANRREGSAPGRLDSIVLGLSALLLLLFTLAIWAMTAKPD